MKHREDMDIKGEVNGLRKFEKFEEKHFEPRQGKGRGAHMDRGLFFQFLEKRGCAEMFQILFGVEGKTAESDSDWKYYNLKFWGAISRPTVPMNC